MNVGQALVAALACWVFALGSTAGCAGAERSASHQRSTSSSEPPVSCVGESDLGEKARGGAGSDEKREDLPELSRATLKRIADLEHAHDYNRFAAAARSLGEWEPGTVRPTRGAYVFVVGYDRWRRFPLRTGMTARGTVFMSDGRLSPSTVLPGHRIDDAEVKELTRLLAAPGKTDVTSGPTYRHHVFVVFSPSGVKEVAVDLEYGRWTGHGVYPADPAVVVGLRAICERAGAPLCDLASDDPDLVLGNRLWWSQETEPVPMGVASTPRRKSRSLRIDATRPLSSLSDVDKRLACLWNLEHMHHEPRPDRWMGLVTGDWALVQTWLQCVERFPTCDEPIGGITPCMEAAQKGDVWLTLTEVGRACASKRDCMWGISWAQGAEPPPESFKPHGALPSGDERPWPGSQLSSAQMGSQVPKLW